MGNEQSTDTVPTDEPSTPSSSPSLEPASTLSHSPSTSPKASTEASPSPSPPEPSPTQRRKSLRTKRWTDYNCFPAHATRKACEEDPKSRRYIGDPSRFTRSSSSSDEESSVSNSSDSESEQLTKPTKNSSSSSTDTYPGSSTDAYPGNFDDSEPELGTSLIKQDPDLEDSPKMTEKRTRTRKPASGSEPKAKKAKTTKERDGGKGEGGEECACSGSERHGNVTQCEERRKVWGDVVTSIIVSSQGMVVVHVGGENGTLKQSFVVHRELLMLNSSFFCSLLAEKVKVQVEENEQLRVKSEETEVPGLGDGVVTRRDARTEEDLPLEEQRKQLESDAGRMIGIRWTEIGQEKEQPKDGGGSTCSSSLSSLSGQFDDVVQSALFPDLISKPNSATQPQPSPINHPSTPGTTAVPPITKLHVAGINPIHFSAFISYIYTQHISPSLSTLLLPQPHLFPTLYLLASQLGSPNFMNYVLTQHIQTKDTSWPSPEQVQYIYSATAAYHPLSVDIPGECGTMAGMDNEGPRILKRFTAACIAANCPFEKYTEGETMFVEWDNLLKDCAGLGRDVVMAQAKWIEKKPWDEGYRKEWMAEERGLEERWEEIFGNGEL